MSALNSNIERGPEAPGPPDMIYRSFAADPRTGSAITEPGAAPAVLFPLLEAALPGGLGAGRARPDEFFEASVSAAPVVPATVAAAPTRVVSHAVPAMPLPAAAAATPAALPIGLFAMPPPAPSVARFPPLPPIIAPDLAAPAAPPRPLWAPHAPPPLVTPSAPAVFTAGTTTLERMFRVLRGGAPPHNGGGAVGRRLQDLFRCL